LRFTSDTRPVAAIADASGRASVWRRLAFACAPLLFLAFAAAQQATQVPNKNGSLKFVAMGDNGTGDEPQYDIGRQMVTARSRFPFDLVIMLGDNMYGGQSPSDFVKKFEQPYAPLLAAGVKFQACLGNHDRPENVNYKHYNMNGQRYYTFARGNVRFFALDSTQMDQRQVEWVDGALGDAKEDWKICYFHHPLYSNAARHGSSVDLRVLLEPIFVQRGVNVVFTGHDHVYERVKPQKGIYYFVTGSAGQLRRGNMRPNPDETAAYFDQDQSFMLVEIAGDEMYFETISRTGKTVDSGMARRQARTGWNRDASELAVARISRGTEDGRSRDGR
jgi:predicted phosphodiesterase